MQVTEADATSLGAAKTQLPALRTAKAATEELLEDKLPAVPDAKAITKELREDELPAVPTSKVASVEAIQRLLETPMLAE